jgi:hypothetical protein
MEVLGFEPRLYFYKILWTVTDYKLLLLNISKESNNICVKVKTWRSIKVLLFTETINVY